MAVKVKEKVRHDGAMYNPGDTIKKIKKEDEERLINLGLVERDETNQKNEAGNKDEVSGKKS